MQDMNRSSEPINAPLSAPPRLLLWLVVVIFFLLIVGVLAGISYFTGGQRLVSLIPYVAIAFFGVLILAIGGALVFRRSLPRLAWLWVTLIALVLVVGAGFGGIYAYRSVLPPRYQEQMITEVPFMRAFLPPTPPGGSLPTVAPREGDISPEDLLALPLTDATATPAATQEPTASPAIVLAPTATPLPSATPTSLPPTAVPTDPSTPVSAAGTSSSAVSRPLSTRMYGFTWIRETWNNCGPANITMALSHYGWRETQEYAANFLKPNPEDKNVSPAEMVNFVRQQTEVRAITRVGGDMDMLKNFIAANIPVITETGYSLEGENWLGHYQTIVGYDDNQSSFFIYDSWLGDGEDDAGMAVRYNDFDANWQAFNRTFIAVYEPDREGVVQQLLGDRADVNADAQHALEVAIGEARTNPQNAFAWFNIGSSYTKLGDYERAAAAFDHARQLDLPYRMLWYQFGPFEAYFETGRYDDVLALAANNANTSDNFVEETFYWEGRVYAAQGDRAKATAAFQQALAKNPNYQAARDALNNL